MATTKRKKPKKTPKPPAPGGILRAAMERTELLVRMQTAQNTIVTLTPSRAETRAVLGLLHSQGLAGVIPLHGFEAAPDEPHPDDLEQSDGGKWRW